MPYKQKRDSEELMIEKTLVAIQAGHMTLQRQWLDTGSPMITTLQDQQQLYIQKCVDQH